VASASKGSCFVLVSKMRCEQLQGCSLKVEWEGRNCLLSLFPVFQFYRNCSVHFLYVSHNSFLFSSSCKQGYVPSYYYKRCDLYISTENSCMALSVVVASFCLRNTHCFKTLFLLYTARESAVVRACVCVCVCVCARARTCAFVRVRYGACKR
jgi:hypothetical protein